MMAKSLDELIDFLLEEVALSGERGKPKIDTEFLLVIRLECRTGWPSGMATVSATNFATTKSPLFCIMNPLDYFHIFEILFPA